MNVRLTKPTLWCKVSIALLALSITLVNAAEPYGSRAPDTTLRECISMANDAAALANCERLEQAALKASIERLYAAIRVRLDQTQRLVFDRSATAWETFFEQESAMLELSLRMRRDGLGPKLRPGALTRLYEQRDQQLREHLHNLSVASPTASEVGK